MSYVVAPYPAATNSNRVSFEYLCRVCAINTKKNNTEAECVYILKTPNLKYKLQKFLYLTVLDNDDLPKVLCITCFRKVEATASLSKIAKQTQKEFREFVQNMMIPVMQPPTQSPQEESSTPEYVPLMTANLNAGQQKSVPSPETLRSTQPPPLPPPKLQHKDEVVVNVSINDPLTRETQHKMLTACQKQGQKPVDSRNAPLSIAQRAFTTNTKHAESAAGKTAATAAAANKAKTPGGVINFFHGRRGTQVTTYTSGGYMIGHAGEPSQTAEQQAMNRAANQSNHSVLLKRKPQLRAGTQTGQVSLLKVSQNLKPKPAKPTEEEAPEALPKNIIIASTKPKRDSDNGSGPAKATESVPSVGQGFPEDISLGTVIKDNDLLRLILKALKWPLDKKNIELQMSRLKGSKFTVVMSDPNLLQDTDLTQILGPYLRPAMTALESMRPPQPQLLVVAAEKLKPQPKQCVLTSIPYKLPAETSLQLLPASPEATEDQPLPSTSRSQRPSNEQPSLLKKNQPEPAAILISDEEDDTVGKPGPRLGVQRVTITRNVPGKVANRRGHLSGPSVDDDGLCSDDIVMLGNAKLECVPAAAVSSTTTKPLKIATTTVAQPPNDDPQITRPIVKRRKVQFMSSTLPLAQTSGEKPATATPSYVVCSGERTMTEVAGKLPPMPPLQRKPSIAEHPRPSIAPAPLKGPPPPATVSTVTSSSASDAVSAPKLPVRKVAGSKAALGQHLLEAIGLPKQVGVFEDATAKLHTGPSEPIQQIRTALKRSLKQAQEQQQKQRKHEEPIIQDADSTTTKHSVKEVPVEAKLKNSAISSTHDLEEHNDLVGHSNEEDDKTEQEPQVKRNKTEEPAKETPKEQMSVEVKVELPEAGERVPRKRGRKSKEEKLAMEAEARRKEEELATANNSSGRSSRNTRRTNDSTETVGDIKRPVRASKTMSKYYKAPQKGSKSTGTPTRTTRNRH